MGWSGGAEVMDAAIDGAIRLCAEAWQLASGLGDVRTPALVNAMVADPELEGRLDDIIRPYVRAIADALNEMDWDTWNESKYFDRFPQEMLGHNDAEHLEWLDEEAAYAEDDGRAQRAADAFRARMTARHGIAWVREDPR